MRRPDVDRMLDELPAQALLQWLAYFEVRREKDADEAQRRQDAADGYDDETIIWTGGGE